jgi:hypothetical protein
MVLMKLKMAVLAPIPSARVKAAAVVNRGFRRRARSAYSQSFAYTGIFRGNSDPALAGLE